jgi:DNA-binding GntR family transcriptional regulator
MRLIHNSLHDDVANQLRERIFGAQLAPGSFIDEAQLCEEMAISRTPLREALKVLAAEGLVRHEPRRGSFVNQVTEQDLDEIFPVIALLEGRCAHEAATHANDGDIAALETMHQRLQAHAASKDIQSYYAANFAIHEAIITLANNKWLAQVIADLRKILKLARLQQLHAPGRLEQSLSEHMAVFAAIKVHDGEGADAAMRTHLLRQREALRELSRNQKSRLLA